MKRVSITLPEDIVNEIDRWETNRSRFVLVATQRELELRRRQALERSLKNPHPESSGVAEVGIEEWGSGRQKGDDDLLGSHTGRAVRWNPDAGWHEEES